MTGENETSESPVEFLLKDLVSVLKAGETEAYWELETLTGIYSLSLRRRND